MTKRIGILLILFMVAIGTACISRYRTDLYMVTESGQDKIKVEQTEYVVGAVINDPYAEQKIVQGDGNCIILHTGTRGEGLKSNLTETLFLSYDEYLRTLIYIQLPPEPQPGVVDLDDRSFVQILGRYEQPTETKIFLPSNGELTIDSIADQKMFCALDGEFRNNSGDSLTYRGKFKIKIAD
jgi:hypothetical protein